MRRGTVSDLESLLERAVQAGLAKQQSRLLSVLGQARTVMGDLDAARMRWTVLAGSAQELGNPMGAAMDTINLAFVAVLSTDAVRGAPPAARTGAHSAANRSPPRRLLHALRRRLPCQAGRAVGSLSASPLGGLSALRVRRRADNRLRRREREHDIERARQALDPATCAATEREAATGSIQSDLAWALAGAGRGAGSTSVAEIGIPPANR